jgi:hypothetical protein
VLGEVASPIFAAPQIISLFSFISACDPVLLRSKCRGSPAKDVGLQSLSDRHRSLAGFKVRDQLSRPGVMLISIRGGLCQSLCWSPWVYPFLPLEKLLSTNSGHSPGQVFIPFSCCPGVAWLNFVRPPIVLISFTSSSTGQRREHSAMFSDFKARCDSWYATPAC